MRNAFLLFVAVVLMTSVVGCGSTDSTIGLTTDAAQPDSPADVVAGFLEAVRIGDSSQASSHLTPLSLQRIEEQGMAFAPPSSETAQYKVGEIEMFEEDKAFVDSVWIEQDADGKPYDEKMTWGLRLTDQGWRISGMAAHMGPGQPPILVDFENPGQLMATPGPASPSQPDGIPRQAVRAPESLYR